MASSDCSPVSSFGSMHRALIPENPLKLTVAGVYALGREIAQDLQKISVAHGENAVKGVVERIVKTLEWLEVYVEETEALRTSNCKLLLKADELASEKARRKTLEQELKGISLVAEERGRQRDALASRVSDLEAHNSRYQERIQEYEQLQLQMLRKERYSTAETILEESTTLDYQSRTKSLDRRDMKKVKEKKTKDKDYVIEQLQKELGYERRKVKEMRESRALEQRRTQQRIKHMEEEIANLNKQLLTAQTLIEKLNEEKTALIERSEVLTEVKAVQLATVARQSFYRNGDSSCEDKELPTFYKKDLVAVLKDRTELKEKVTTLQEDLANLKRRLSFYEDVESDLPQSQGYSPLQTRSSFTLPSRGRSPYSNRSSSSQASTPVKDGHKISERLEGSMVIVDYTSHHLQLPNQYENGRFGHYRRPSHTSESVHSSNHSIVSTEPIPIPREKESSSELTGSTSL